MVWDKIFPVDNCGKIYFMRQTDTEAATIRTENTIYCWSNLVIRRTICSDTYLLKSFWIRCTSLMLKEYRFSRYGRTIRLMLKKELIYLRSREKNLKFRAPIRWCWNFRRQNS